MTALHRLAHPGGTKRCSTQEGLAFASARRWLTFVLCLLLCLPMLSTAGCRPGGRTSMDQPTPVANPGPSGRSGSGDRPYDENVEVPPGDPGFPKLGRYWVVDPEGLVDLRVVQAADETLEALRVDGLAETVIVIRRSVKHPVEWSTHYGRWLMLGERGGARKNNGLVFLIIPDAPQEAGRVWYSIGRGLPRLTSSDMAPLLKEAASYANAGDLDGAVISIARNIDDILRKIYGRGER